MSIVVSFDDFINLMRVAYPNTMCRSHCREIIGRISKDEIILIFTSKHFSMMHVEHSDAYCQISGTTGKDVVMKIVQSKSSEKALRDIYYRRVYDLIHCFHCNQSFVNFYRKTYSLKLEYRRYLHASLRSLSDEQVKTLSEKVTKAYDTFKQEGKHREAKDLLNPRVNVSKLIETYL